MQRAVRFRIDPLQRPAARRNAVEAARHNEALRQRLRLVARLLGLIAHVDERHERRGAAITYPERLRVSEALDLDRRRAIQRQNLTLRRRLKP